MQDIAPPSPSHVALLRSMELIVESQQQRLSKGTKIPIYIRNRFRELPRLSRDKHPIGWKCETEDEILPKFSRDDVQKLEDDVEMIGRRQAKPTPASFYPVKRLYGRCENA